MLHTVSVCHIVYYYLVINVYLFFLFCCALSFSWYNYLHNLIVVVVYFFFFKQKTAYEMRISDWSSDVCSSDLTTIRTRTITRRCRSPPRRRRTRSPYRSTCRAFSPRWSSVTCRASRWTRRSPGPRARSKASCACESAARGRRRSRRGSARGRRLPLVPLPCDTDPDMADVTTPPAVAGTGLAAPARKRGRLRVVMQRKSTVAFLMTLPLILLIVLLVLYPALYAVHLATLNQSMTRFAGLGHFEFLFGRETFWMVVKQSCIFAISAVILKAIIEIGRAHV